jgi:hypothetical protein
MHLDRHLFLLLRAMHGILPLDIRMLIMDKALLVRDSDVQAMGSRPLEGRSSFARKRRAKRMHCCHLCAKVHVDGPCGRSWSSTNAQDDRLKWIRHGKCKTGVTPFEASFGALTVRKHVKGEIRRLP